MLSATVTRGGRVLIVPRRGVLVWDVVVIPFGRIGTERVETLPVDGLQYVLVRLRLVRLVVLLKMENGVQNRIGGETISYRVKTVRVLLTGVLEEDFVHVRGSILEQLVVRVEDDDRDLAVAQNAELVSLLHESEFSLGEGHLAIALVADARDRDLFPPHLSLTGRLILRKAASSN